MKKKSILLLALGAIMSLSACSPSSVDVDKTLPTDDPTSPVTIVFYSCLGHEKGSNFAKIVDKFNEDYLGKYVVDVQKVAGTYDALHSTIKTLVSGGTIPALAMGYPDSFSEYITKYIEDSQILRLDNFINDPVYGYSETELSDFVPGYYAEGNSYQFEGVWSMPMYKSTEVMYYNASYFAGVNPLNNKKFPKGSPLYAEYVTKYNAASGSEATDEALEALKTFVKANGGYAYDVPATWDEMVALSGQMLADRATEQIIDTFYPVGYDSDANLMISQMKQRGIEYTVNDEASQSNPAQHFKFVNDDAKALASEIVGLLQSKKLITKGSIGTNPSKYYEKEQCVMSISSTGGSSYNISSNFVVKIAPVPYSGSRPYYIQQGPSICFFNNDNDYIHKGAWLFYKYIANVAYNTGLSLENSYDPIRKSCYETTEYSQWIAHPTGSGLKYDVPKITKTLTDYYMTSPVFIGSGTARDEIGSIISYIYNGEAVDSAFARAYNKCVAAA